VLNFSAPFIPQFFNAQVQDLLPFCDYIICNETEAESWANAVGQPETKDLAAIAKAIANSPKSNGSRPRTSIITHGAESTVFVTSGNDAVVVPVNALKPEEIVDTNAAGDGFAGGFLGALISGRSVKESVEIGHRLGAMVVGQVCFSIVPMSFLYSDYPRLVHNTSGPKSTFCERMAQHKTEQSGLLSTANALYITSVLLLA